MQVTARLCVLALLAAALGGCTQTLSGSVAGGESKVFERPPFVVKGKAPYDQRWIDSQIEGGVAAYGWKRPAPRPASLDAQPARKAAPPAPVKKRGVIKRIKDAFVPQPATPFVDRFTPAIETPLTRIAPRAAPRDPVDELLHPIDGGAK